MKKSLPPTFHHLAFTLVELIVVIAVLAILAAISFTTVSNVTSSARDSARLTDLSSIRSSLESYRSQNGIYPTPDNATAITWSGNLAWNQGVFGETNTRTLNTLSLPKDPKYQNYYTYSRSNTKTEYEIATVLEKANSLNNSLNNINSYFPIENTYAQGEKYEITTKGNYNGIALKVESNTTNAKWILTVPTIIASDIKNGTLEQITFSLPKSNNLPNNYTSYITPTNTPTLFTPIQVYSGACSNLTDTDLSTLADNLYTAYNTTNTYKDSESIKSLVSKTDASSKLSWIKALLGNAPICGKIPTDTPAVVIANDGSTAAKAGVTCKTLHDAGVSSDGIYWVKPDAAAAQQVYCDMTTDGGGWTFVWNSVANYSQGFTNSPVANATNKTLDLIVKSNNIPFTQWRFKNAGTYYIRTSNIANGTIANYLAAPWLSTGYETDMYKKIATEDYIFRWCWDQDPNGVLYAEGMILKGTGGAGNDCDYGGANPSYGADRYVNEIWIR